jgi:hypothetical protein
MNSELIIKIGPLVYAKLYNDFGYVENKDSICFQDKKGEYDCNKIFWRFYWIRSKDGGLLNN